MPRKVQQPAYRLHKPRGCAVVTIDGKNHYLGKFDSPESHHAYARLIDEWQGRGSHRHQPPVQAIGGQPLSVNEVLEQYWQFCQGYYIKDGKPTSEVANAWTTIRVVQKLYGMILASEFGPRALKAVRQYMIDEQDLVRSEINKRIKRIKRIFKWASSEELVPVSVFQSLQTVSGLRFGKTTARESKPVKPVPDLWVGLVLPFVSAQIRAMILIQRLTGMRPSEVTLLRPRDVDTTDAVWIYEMPDHKNRWRDHRRIVPLGPVVQQILAPFLRRDPDAYCFSPREAEEERSLRRREQRRSPLTPSQAKRRKKQHRQRATRDRYDRDSYRRAIEYGIKKARLHGIIILPWTPCRLRHNHGTAVRRLFGVEAAQMSLGHSTAAVTEVYAEKNLELAVDVAQKIG